MTGAKGGGSGPLLHPVEKCDFCSNRFPSWVHPSKDFALPEIGWVSSDGAWAACEACHELIENEEREKLASRAVRMYFYWNPLPAWQVRQIRRDLERKISMMHEGFWANRNGEPYRQSAVREGQHREE